MINIGLKPEYIINIDGFLITNTFFTTLLVTLFLAILALFFHIKKNKKNLVLEALSVLVFELLKLTDAVTKNRKLSKRVLPLIATFFIFILSANLLALIPGFLGSVYVETQEGPLPILRSPNSDLTTTLALAIFSVLSIQYFSLRILGLKKYLLRFFNFRSPLSFILGFFEMISEGVKVLSFSFRLFGNIFAGEVLLLIIAFLIPYIIPLPFIILEVFVGIIQAFIFAMLTLTFIKTSIMRHIPTPKRGVFKVEAPFNN
jgi:F-type H+-transporting ATPase subunit a